MGAAEFSDNAFGIAPHAAEVQAEQARLYAADLVTQYVNPLHDEAYVLAGAILSARNTWAMTDDLPDDPRSALHSITTGLLAVGDEHLNVAPSGQITFPAVELSLWGSRSNGTVVDRAYYKALGLSDITKAWQELPDNWHRGLGVGLPIALRSYEVTNYAPPGSGQWTAYTERAPENKVLSTVNPELKRDLAGRVMAPLVRPFSCYVRPNPIFTKGGKPTHRLIQDRGDKAHSYIVTSDLPADPKQAAELLHDRLAILKEQTAANLAVIQNLGASALMPARMLTKDKDLRKWWRENSRRAEENLAPPQPKRSFKGRVADYVIGRAAAGRL